MLDEVLELIARQAIRAFQLPWCRIYEYDADRDCEITRVTCRMGPDGEIKLVDYDGMCVPALVGRDQFVSAAESQGRGHAGAGIRVSEDTEVSRRRCRQPGLRSGSAEAVRARQ